MFKTLAVSLSFSIALFYGVAEAATYTVICNASNPCTSVGLQTGGPSLGAEAVFMTSGTTLTVDLYNLDGTPTGKLTNGDVLTGLFFGGASQLGLTPGTAKSVFAEDGNNDAALTTLGVDGTAEGCKGAGAAAGADVGCQWGFLHPDTGQGEFVNLLTTSGYSLTYQGVSGGNADPNFGSGSNTNYKQGNGPVNVHLDGTTNGIGILPGNGTYSSANTSADDVAYVGKEAEFALTGIASGLTDAQLAALIGQVRFQFGTDATTDYFQSNVPEPGFYGALALGMSGLFWALVRRRAKTQA